MGKPQVSFDAEIFARTASLFESKRDAFAPTAVEVLAADIMRRLARGRPSRTDSSVPDIHPDEIAAFCDALVQPDPTIALRFIQQRRANGLTRQDVYLGYVGAAARHLGTGWDEDRFTFLDVTYGAGHLYALMRALREEAPTGDRSRDSKRAALFATVPGEDHGIGITVAADLFRDAGWDIDLQTGTDHDALVAHVEGTQPSIIGLSLNSDYRLDALVRLVVALRIVMPHAIIGVAPAAGFDPKRLTDLVDIDLVFHDALSARDELERLIRVRG